MGHHIFCGFFFGDSSFASPPPSSLLLSSLVGMLKLVGLLKSRTPTTFFSSLPFSKNGLVKSHHNFSTQSKQLPSSVDVVVVGGGSIGTSTLYHLCERGVNAILLEKDQLSAGTTWHSAGMLWRLRPSDVEIELHTYTRTMCQKLQEETELGCWIENGGLFIAKNEERLSEYQRLSELGKYYGIESRVVSPSDIVDIHPLINAETAFGGIYSPTDGSIDPSGIVAAYAKAAKKIGGKVFEQTPLASIEMAESFGNSRRRVTGVTTANGQSIKCKTVINACGVWANQVSQMVGVTLPLLAMKHAFVLTEPIEGMHEGLPNVRDHDLSIYLKTQGNSIGAGGYEQNPEFWDQVDPNFAFGLFDLDWETFEQNLSGHLERCPAIGEIGIKSTVCGPESFTPDHKPLVGPQPGIEGYFNACGFNSMGMMLGGGMGREIATWIIEGSPSLDLFSFDCARFHDSCVKNPLWVKERTHESYAKTYSIVLPRDEPLAGRQARTSPLYHDLLERGCVYQARHGFERPGWFSLENKGGTTQAKPYDYYGSYETGGYRLGSIPLPNGEQKELGDFARHSNHLYESLIKKDLTFGWGESFDQVREECLAVRTGAALFDQSYFGKFVLKGRDAFSAAQYICGADLEQKIEGDVVYTPLCNAHGGVEADLTVSILPRDKFEQIQQGLYFCAGGSTMTKDYEWITRHLENFDASLEDKSDDFALLSIQGPLSRALIQSVMTEDPSSLNHESFPFSTTKVVQIAGVNCLCLRLTFVGELGFELHIPADKARNVYQALRQEGEKIEERTGKPIRDAGYSAIDSLSAEKNFRHWHADLSNVDTPFEAGIGFTVLPKLKKEKVDFIGRDALMLQHESGVLRRKLVCLTLDDPKVPLHGLETIWRNGDCVGLVKSTAFGHTIQKTVATGYVVNRSSSVRSHSAITTSWLKEGCWEIGDRGENHSATFHARAPYDPKSLSLKSEFNLESLLNLV